MSSLSLLLQRLGVAGLSTTSSPSKPVLPWKDGENSILIDLADAYPLWTFIDVATRFSEDHYPDDNGHVRDAAECLQQLGILQSQRIKLEQGNTLAGPHRDGRLARSPAISKAVGGAVNKLYIARLLSSRDSESDEAINKLHSQLCRACRNFQSRYRTEAAGVSFHGMKHPADVSVKALRESSLSRTCCKFILRNIDWPKCLSEQSSSTGTLQMSNINYNIAIYLGSGTERTQVACFSLVHLDDWRPLDGRNVNLSFWETMTREQASIRRTISRIRGQDDDCDALCVQIRTWLDQCSRHVHCFSDKALPLPDRILQLDSPHANFIRLKEVPHDRERDRYVALSYCWGRHGQYLLNDTTYSELQAGLHVSKLPTTIQDAVKVARTLGYSYLWVDALCIKQGSAVDWEQQSSKMAHTYGNAHLTLLASSAAGVSEGSLRPRPSSETYCGYHEHRGRKKPLYLSNPFLGFDGYPVHGRIFDNGLDDETDWRTGTSMPFVAHEPLTTRAWAAQERGLSPRKVYFGSKQMFWECRACLVLETGYRIRDQRRSSDRTQAHTIIMWYRAVEVYSACDLTRMTDRLPAISGTASVLAAVRQDDYLAGHWRRELMRSSLIWEPTKQRSSSSERQYTAPSWSWASHEHGIQYPHVEGRLWHVEAISQLLAHHISVKGRNPFGEVGQGWLDIRAPVLCTTVAHLPEKVVEYRDGTTTTIKDHARAPIKHPNTALRFRMKVSSMADDCHPAVVEVEAVLTIDYNDLSPDTSAFFVVLSKRTNATRRRDLQRLQPENSTIRRSTFGGIVVTPVDVDRPSPMRCFRRIGAFYDLTAALPDEKGFLTMRLV